MSDADLLDEAFERAVDLLEGGETPDADALCRGRTHLRREVEALIEQAVAVVRGTGLEPDAVRAASGGTIAAGRASSVPGYSVLRELGRGGMGAVYLARQTQLGDRLVALKVLPHIVAIHDVVSDGQTQAFAMEWIEGTTLGRVVDALTLSSADQPPTTTRSTDAGLLSRVCELFGPGATLPDRGYIAFVCRVGVEIARALGEVHRAGLVHRDVKPSNILLRSDGTALLSDFGLVRDEHAPGVTLTRNFQGTIWYAPPEQLGSGSGDEHAIGPATDIYSMGATLYHAIALRPPFPAKSAGEVMRQIELGLCTPLRRVNPRTPRDIETIIAKAMDPDPSRRYASADAMADDLQRAMREEPIVARNPTFAYVARKFVRRHAVLVAATCAVIAALSLAVVGTSIGLLRANDARREAERNAATSRFNEYVACIAAADAAIRADDIGPALRRLDAAPAELRGWEWMHLHGHADQSAATLLAGCTHAPAIAISPDGTSVVAVCGSELRLITTSDGSVVIVVPVAAGSDAAFSHDGSLVAVFNPSLSTVDLRDAASLRIVASVPTELRGVTSLAWSSLRQNLFIGGSNASGGGTIEVRRRDNFERIGLRDDLPSPPLRLEFANCGAWLLANIGGSTRRISIPQFTLSAVRPFDGADSGAVVADPAGGLLASAGALGVSLWSADTLSLRAGLTGQPAADAAFAPGGLLYAAVGNRIVAWDVRTAQQIAELRGHSAPIRVIQTDRAGDRVVTSSDDGTVKLWTSRPPGPALPPPAAAGREVLSHAGRRFELDRGGAVRVTLALPDRPPTDVLTLASRSREAALLALSPDGTLSATDSGGRTVATWANVIPIPTPSAPAATPDGLLRVGADDPSDAGRLAGSIAASGDRIIAGAIGVDANTGSDAGAAYVFVHERGTWRQEAKLVPAERSYIDYSGSVVDISGDLAAVGARNSDFTVDGTSRYDTGSVAIFARGPGGWTQEATLRSESPAAFAYFGRDVCFGNDTLFVSADNRPEPAQSRSPGMVLVWRRESVGNWRVVQTLLPDPELGPLPEFGAQIDVAEDLGILAVAAPRAEPAGGATGGALVLFRSEHSTWRVLTTLRLPADAAGGHFAGAFRLRGHDLFMTRQIPGKPGRVEWFDLSSGRPVHRQTIEPEQDAERFGESIDLFGDSLFIRARVFAPSGAILESVDRYARTPTGWVYATRVRREPREDQGTFGITMAVTDGFAAFGAPGENGTYEDEGAVWVLPLAPAAGRK